MITTELSGQSELPLSFRRGASRNLLIESRIGRKLLVGRSGQRESRIHQTSPKLASPIVALGRPLKWSAPLGLPAHDRGQRSIPSRRVRVLGSPVLGVGGRPRWKAIDVSATNHVVGENVLQQGLVEQYEPVLSSLNR